MWAVKYTSLARCNYAVLSVLLLLHCYSCIQKLNTVCDFVFYVDVPQFIMCACVGAY